MRLIFVHGWSVTNTDTYGNLPQALVNQAASTTLELTIDHIQLSRYISFNDQTRMQDIARALDQALRDLPGNNDMCIEPLSSSPTPPVDHSFASGSIIFMARNFKPLRSSTSSNLPPPIMVPHSPSSGNLVSDDSKHYSTELNPVSRF